MKYFGILAVGAMIVASTACHNVQNEVKSDADFAAELKLADYRPVSVFKIPVSEDRKSVV